MKVMESVGKTAGKESTTGPRLVDIATMKKEAEGKIMGPVRKWVAMPLYTAKRIVLDWRAGVRSDKFMNRLADAMISEKSVPQIREMLQLKPGSQKLLQSFSVFLASLAGTQVRSIRGRAKRQDFQPPTLKKQRRLRAPSR